MNILESSFTLLLVSLEAPSDVGTFGAWTYSAVARNSIWSEILISKKAIGISE
jgi:hypothetical protein